MENNKEYFYSKYKGLIPKVIKDCNCQYKSKEEYQDYYDIGEIGLLRAINHFNIIQEETTTYFYNSIKREIFKYFRYRTLGKRYINYLDIASLDENLEGLKYSLSEVIQDENVNIEKQTIKNEVNESLYKAINTLKPTYKDIICKYYGINSKKYTIRKIAKMHKISRQAITVKRNIALNKLKKEIIKNGVEKNDLRLYN